MPIVEPGKNATRRAQRRSDTGSVNGAVKSASTGRTASRGKRAPSASVAARSGSREMSTGTYAAGRRSAARRSAVLRAFPAPYSKTSASGPIASAISSPCSSSSAVSSRGG